MGLFNIFKQNKQNKQEVVENHYLNNNIILEKAQMLNLRKEKLKIVLTKQNIDNIICKVAFVIYKSSSMQALYQEGFVQNTIERIFPLAVKFDDNQTLDVWYFNDSYKRLNPATMNNFHNYVEEEIMKKHKVWGSTNFAPVMTDVLKKYTIEEKDDIPVYVIFITDGENYDCKDTTNTIKKASKYPIFWQFIGIGDEDFAFLKKLDEMDGRYVDNANFFSVNDLNEISDEELYERMMKEFSDYLYKIKNLGMIRE